MVDSHMDMVEDMRSTEDMVEDTVEMILATAVGHRDEWNIWW